MNVGSLIRTIAGMHARASATVLRPLTYILVIGGVAVGAAGVKGMSNSIFACPAAGYSDDRYLAYCDAKGYGEYEHGAFWFGLEPTALRSATKANVVFVGNSRMQYGFSTTATDDWFAKSASAPYVLGFAGYENVRFTRELLRKLHPEAKVYVVNIDGFFVETEAPVARIVMHDRMAAIRYKVKQLWQWLHRPICSKFPAICGAHYAIFRSRTTGAWRDIGVPPGTGGPVAYRRTPNSAEVARYAAIGRAFLSDLHARRECVILTMVPSSDTRIGDAEAIAEALGLTLVVPELYGLETFDHSHLTHASAERWSKAFFDAAGDRIDRCLESPTQIPNRS